MKKQVILIGMLVIAGSANSQNSTYNSPGPCSGLGANNSAFGFAAFGCGAGTAGGGTANTALGLLTLSGGNSGNYNVAVGNEALRDNTTGEENTATGSFALSSNVSGSYNTANGINALASNQSGIENVAVGGSALSYNTSGSYNTTAGLASMLANSTGKFNTALGYHTLWSNTTGENNTALGNKADIISGNFNTVVGDQALVNGGAHNAVLGNSAYVTAGQRNTVLGNSSYADSGDDNFVGGSYAWTASGSYANTAIGHGANVGSSSFYCTAVGTQATIAPGQSGASAFGMNSYAKGLEATAIGAGSFVNGDKATALGRNSNASFDNSTAVGESAITNANNRIMLGSPFLTDVVTVAQFVAWSDKRFKSDVRAEEVKGLDFIKLLRPVVYTFENKKLAEHMTKNMPDSIRQSYINRSCAAKRQSGFIAQEVEEAANKSGYNFSGVVVPRNENDIYGLAYSEFVVPLVKGMQEQQKMIEDLQAQLSELQHKNTTGVAQLSNMNDGFVMDQNIPNPFNNETVINYTLSDQTKNAILNVYDLSGKQITSFSITERGTSSITVTSEKLAAGIYIYSIIADGKVMDSKRMIVAEK